MNILQAMKRHFFLLITLIQSSLILAQGVVVSSVETGTIDIPASKFSSVYPQVDGSANQSGLVVELSDRSRLALGKGSSVQPYEGQYEDSLVVAGSLPELFLVGGNSYISAARLSYERLPRMNTPRSAHQLIPSSSGMVAVGGHTTGFQPTATAELFDGTQWRDISIASAHDDGFSVILSDGNVLVGGGYKTEQGEGRLRNSDVYSFKKETFTEGPLTNMNRARANGIVLDGKVYVSGNWHYDLTGKPSTPPFDIYDGRSFSIAGAQTPRSRPYLFTIEDEIIEFASSDYFGNQVPFSARGHYFADRCNPSKQELYEQDIPMFDTWTPLELPADVRPVEGQSAVSGDAFILTQQRDGSYAIVRFHGTSNGISTERFAVPSYYPSTGTPIQFRGGAFVNDARSEAYFIGSSEKNGRWTLYIMTFCFDALSMSISLGDAGPFDFNPSTSSWLQLADGQLAMTGGNMTDDFNPTTEAYVFTPLRQYLVASYFTRSGSTDHPQTKLQPEAVEFTAKSPH